MKRTKLPILIYLLFVSFFALGQSSEVYSTKEGAIDGYDAVAFFKEHKPVKGLKEFSYQWNDAVWYFASLENVKEFKNDPEKYAPQYGGYCAYGTADGHKAPTQPDTWTIVENKLYFNYNQQVKKLWNAKQKEFIEKADRNWPSVKIQ
jgi:YHS domain-containing protein